MIYTFALNINTCAVEDREYAGGENLLIERIAPVLEKRDELISRRENSLIECGIG